MFKEQSELDLPVFHLVSPRPAQRLSLMSRARKHSRPCPWGVRCSSSRPTMRSRHTASRGASCWKCVLCPHPCLSPNHPTQFWLLSKPCSVMHDAMLKLLSTLDVASGRDSDDAHIFLSEHPLLHDRRQHPGKAHTHQHCDRDPPEPEQPRHRLSSSVDNPLCAAERPSERQDGHTRTLALATAPAPTATGSTVQLDTLTPPIRHHSWNPDSKRAALHPCPACSPTALARATA